MADSKKRIYHSVCKAHKIGADAIQREKREGESIMIGSHVISFEEGFFTTVNPKEQKIIEDTHDFKLGRISLINEEQYETLVASTAIIPGAKQETEDVGYDAKDDGESKDKNEIIVN